MHYRRWRLRGDPLSVLKDYLNPPKIRFWNFVDLNGPVPVNAPEMGPCSLWTGAIHKRSGYGKWSADGTTWTAHAYAWMLAGHEVPRGHDVGLDHVCHTVDRDLCLGGLACWHRLCVREAHLEVVAARVNTLRGNAPSAINATKTHCIRGHEFTLENTGTDQRGNRVCRTCNRERRAAVRAALPIQTHCQNGHPLADAPVDGRGRRMCLDCRSLGGRHRHGLS